MGCAYSGMVIGLAGLCGCVSGEAEAERPAVVPPFGAVVASPFSPAMVRVLSLTHFERTPEHGTRVLVFFELLDQWGDTVKGAGALEVRAVAMGGGAENELGNELGGGPRQAVWEIDLADLDRNASLYDPSTRAYRLALKDLPAWLSVLARDGGEPSAGGGAALEIYFRTVGADGRPAVLRDRFALRRPS